MKLVCKSFASACEQLESAYSKYENKSRTCDTSGDIPTSSGKIWNCIQTNSSWTGLDKKIINLPSYIHIPLPRMLCIFSPLPQQLRRLGCGPLKGLLS